MTPELRERIEKKAKELRDYYYDSNVNILAHIDWERLATHCLEQEIRGRIDELKEYPNIFEPRINQLEQQLLELRGVKNEKD